MKLYNYPLWTALITPLNEDLTVDFDSLEKLLVEQKGAKNGLLILGSTGEALNLSLSQKKEIIDFVISKNTELPIMIGVGGHDLIETKQWLSFLEQKNIHAYLMVTPLYAKPGDHGQYLWFKELMDSVTRPVMLYNVPSRTGISLSLSAVERLKDHKNFWAIKEASGNIEQFKLYLKACDKKSVYCGDDALFYEFSNNGSCGLISVASNVWPKQTSLYVKKCLSRTFNSNQLWEEAANSLFIASNPIPAKAILFDKKRISSKTMMPPLSSEDLTDTSLINEFDEKINKWFNQEN